MSRILIACAVALLPAAARADDPKPKAPAAAGVLEEGLAAAKKDGKAVFLAFGSPGCVWCKHLNEFNARPAVAKTLGKHLVFVNVDVVENEGGQDLYEKYAHKPGSVPVWVILAADGKVLADSFEDVKGEKENVGFPFEPNEVAHYEKALKAAVPALTADEVTTVLKELKESGKKSEKEDK